jgi:hypothetical protein
MPARPRAAETRMRRTVQPANRVYIVVTMARVEGQEFDWDENNVLHLGRHKVSPLEAEQAILDPNAVMLEIRIAGPERSHEGSGPKVERPHPRCRVHLSG